MCVVDGPLTEGLLYWCWCRLVQSIRLLKTCSPLQGGTPHSAVRTHLHNMITCLTLYTTDKNKSSYFDALQSLRTRTIDAWYLGHSGWFMSMDRCQRETGALLRGLDHCRCCALQSTGHYWGAQAHQANLSLASRERRGNLRWSDWGPRLGFGGVLRTLCLWASTVWVHSF